MARQSIIIVTIEYIPKTRGERTTDTIDLFPEQLQMPKTSSKDRLASATEDLLIAILKKPHPLTPFLDEGTKTNDAIQKLKEMFTPRQQNERHLQGCRNKYLEG